MTQPTPDDKAKAEADAKAKAEAEKAKAARPKRGQVVHFTARDTHVGDEYEGLGVVTLVPADGPVVVRPLAEFDIQVDPAKVEPVVVDEA